MEIKNKVAISNIYIELTRACNLNCPHCLRGDADNNSFMSFDQIDRIFVDPVKKARIVSLDKNTKRVPFDMFYTIWNEYEGIKMVKTFSSKVNFNKK